MGKYFGFLITEIEIASIHCYAVSYSCIDRHQLTIDGYHKWDFIRSISLCLTLKQLIERESFKSFCSAPGLQAKKHCRKLMIPIY